MSIRDVNRPDASGRIELPGGHVEPVQREQASIKHIGTRWEVGGAVEAEWIRNETSNKPTPASKREYGFLNSTAERLA
jgi:hypothetical protein